MHTVTEILVFVEGLMIVEVEIVDVTVETIGEANRVVKVIGIEFIVLYYRLVMLLFTMMQIRRILRK